MTKISLMTEAVALDNAADWLTVVDTSDLTMSPAGTTKKIKPSTLWSNVDVPAGQTADYDGTPFMQAVLAQRNVFGGGAGNMTLDVGSTKNVGFGLEALVALTTGSGINTAFGDAVLHELTTGSYNCGFGVHALGNSITATGNCAYGVDAIRTSLASTNNCAFGNSSLFFADSANENSAFGHFAMFGAVGSTPAQNCAFGAYSMLLVSTGINNCGFGWNSLNQITDGSGNNAFGQYAGFGVTGSDRGVYIGIQSGFGNHSGDGNILIGAATIAASYGQVTTASRCVAIGDNVAVASQTANNQLVVSNYIYGTGMSGTGATISPGKIGFGVKAPAVECDVDGEIKTKSRTVVQLPSAATAGEGARGFVTDATSTTFMSIVAGGGANKVPVVSNGTNWLIG